jgi:hypothetical protein
LGFQIQQVGGESQQACQVSLQEIATTFKQLPFNSYPAFVKDKLRPASFSEGKVAEP